MQKVLVSIVIPIYNAEDYIRDCVLGIFAQTFTYWELILINDGSTDNSKNICDALSKQDGRIKVVHKHNSGVSNTRNIGIDIAQGKYIIFLDADDYWYENDALAKLVNYAEKYELDIVRGEYKAVDSDSNDVFIRPLSSKKKDLSYKVLTSGQFYTKIMCGENFLVLNLIKRASIGTLRFNEDRVFLEDMEFFAYLLLRPLKCMFIPLRFYAYRKLTTSASHTPSIKKLSDGFAMCNIFDECYAIAEDIDLRMSYKRNRVMKYYLTLKNLSSSVFYAKRHSIIEELNLVTLQQQVCDWAQKECLSYPIYVYLNPKISVGVIRFVHFCKVYLTLLRRQINRVLHF